MRRVVLLCLYFCASAVAHEGHSADETHPAAAGVVDGAPASLVLSDLRLELVATQQAGDWVIYVDDISSNAPLRGLSLQVQQGQRQLQAAAAGDDTYRLPVDVLEAGTPVRFIVRGADWYSQLQGKLPMAPQPAAPRDSANQRSKIVFGVSLLLALLISAWLVVCRGRRK